MMRWGGTDTLLPVALLFVLAVGIALEGIPPHLCAADEPPFVAARLPAIGQPDSVAGASDPSLPPEPTQLDETTEEGEGVGEECR